MPATAGADCADWHARLVSAQGRVEFEAATVAGWRPAVADQHFCAGDRLRTLAGSRAALQLRNQTYISLDQRTTLVFGKVLAEQPSWIELLTGSLLARSRTPKSLNIRTPFINAAIKGTEFLVSAARDRGQVTVFEGEVVASNDQGQVQVGRGQTATASRGQKPAAVLTLHPEDSVHWSLYYPPLVDLAGLRRRGRDPALAEAGRLFAAGKPTEALAALDALAPSAQGGDYLAVRVGLLLSVGRLDEAEPLLARAAPDTIGTPGLVDALRAVIALAKNHKPEALSLSARAIRVNPQLAVAWLARSYAQQAAFDLEAALAAADQAARLDPENALIAARQAELLASLDRWAEARTATDQAIRLNPLQPRAFVVKGFIELRDGHVVAAGNSFRTALRLAADTPLARLGLGLVAIRRGDLEGGTADLEIAVSLDPLDSLLRSYLGKAYYEQNRNAIAAEEFRLARRFDPKDPTPWFYDAIQKQTENRPVEALHDLQRAIALNGNLAVHRSKLALDQDLAARGAALGRIYNEIGFQRRGLVEGWKAVGADPTDYTSHRLLSDSYYALPRQNVTRMSELLQSQLLQPLNIIPVQPILVSGAHFLLGGLGPAALSLQEFNPMFQRNRFSLLASGLVGTNDTYSNETVHTGLWNNLSYSLGQAHYQTRGFQRNDGVDANFYSAFAQGMVSPWLNLQAEYRHQEIDHGNLFPIFAPLLLDTNTTTRGAADTYRFGLHLIPTEQSDLLGSFIHLAESIQDLGPGPLDQAYTRIRGDIGEVQYLQRFTQVKSIVGGGYSHSPYARLTSADAGISFIPAEPTAQSFGSVYWYNQINLPVTVTWTVGVSGDIWSDSSYPHPVGQVNPKLGMMWNLTEDTLVRAAGFRTMKKPLFTSQTLEPAQLAGFSQFFDDFTGTDATTFGLGLDQRLGPDLAGGIESYWRKLQLPAATLPRQYPATQFQETHYQAYLLWTPHPRWAFSLDYVEEIFEDIGDSDPARNTRTRVVPASLSYFDPLGFFTRFSATYFHQQVELAEGPSHEDVPFLDFTLGYRLPKRLGLAEVQLLNLLNEYYRYEGFQDRTPVEMQTRIRQTLPYVPEFAVFARLTLAF